MQKEITEGMLVRVDSRRLVPFIGRVVYLHQENGQPNGIVRVEVTVPLASAKKPGSLVDVGARFCYPQTED